MTHRGFTRNLFPNSICSRVHWRFELQLPHLNLRTIFGHYYKLTLLLYSHLLLIIFLLNTRQIRRTTSFFWSSLFSKIVPNFCCLFSEFCYNWRPFLISGQSWTGCFLSDQYILSPNNPKCNVQTMRKIGQIFVAFSEKLNFSNVHIT